MIRTDPFDASLHLKATLQVIDAEKVAAFVRLKSKRGFPLPETASVEVVLTQLNLCQKKLGDHWCSAFV